MILVRQDEKYAVPTRYCVFLFFLTLAACQPTTPTPFVPPTADRSSSQSATTISFVSPTPLVNTIKSSPTAAVSTTPLPPTATPPCTNNLKYVSDLTIPDNTVVQPGQVLDKQWQVENSGSCNWDGRYQLKYIGGDALGSVTVEPLYPARTGTQAVVHVSFTSPQQAGTYRTTWQAFDPDGQPFGDPITMQIVVGP